MRVTLLGQVTQEIFDTDRPSWKPLVRGRKVSPRRRWWAACSKGTGFKESARQYVDSIAAASGTTAEWELAPISAAVPSTYYRHMMDLGLFHSPRIASVLAIGGFSLVVAILDFARRRKVSSASESGVLRMSSSSSPQEPAEPYVGAAEASTVAEGQSVRSIEGLAKLPRTDRSATAPSLPFGGFLPLPLPSARDRVVRFATSHGAIAFRPSGA